MVYSAAIQYVAVFGMSMTEYLTDDSAAARRDNVRLGPVVRVGDLQNMEHRRQAVRARSVEGLLNASDARGQQLRISLVFRPP